MPYRLPSRRRQVLRRSTSLIILMVSLIGCQGWLFWNYTSINRDITHGFLVRTNVQQVQYGIAKMESNTRGYVLNPRGAHYRANWQTAEGIILGSLHTLEYLARGARQTEEIARLVEMARTRIARFRETLDLVDRGDWRELERSRFNNSNQQGPQLTAALTDAVASLAASEAALYATQEASLQRTYVLLVIIGLVMLGGMTSLIGSNLRNLEIDKQLYAKLYSANDLLLRELNHRVKNNLQQVASVVRLQMSGSDNDYSKRALGDALSRIQAMALVHEQIYTTHDQTLVIEASAQIASIVGSLEKQFGVTITRTLDAFTMPVNDIVPFALVLNELVTNAIKYGGSDEPISVRFTVVGGGWELHVQDFGSGTLTLDKIETSRSLGLKLVRALLLQLGATLSLAPEPRGSHVVVARAVKGG